MYFDSHYYGKTVFTPFNIIYYNIFGKGGPTLYGKNIEVVYVLVCRSSMYIVFKHFNSIAFLSISNMVFVTIHELLGTICILLINVRVCKLYL